MAQVLLFHHALGLTPGVEAFADDLRDAGHEVTTPDLYAGRTFATVEAGVAHAEEIGLDTIIAEGVAAAERLPHEIVYAGFSLGAMPAQWLAQQRAGACGALLYHSAVPPQEFGGTWPADVPLQMHITVNDPFDDLAVMEELADGGGQLYTYPGSAHLFTDRSSTDYLPEAADRALERSLDFLARL